MFRRLMGLLLILRGLAPLLIVLVIGIAGAALYNDLRAVVAPPLQTIESEIQTVRDEFDTARGHLEDTVGEITSLVRTLQDFRLPDLLPDIPDNISIPRLTIPAFNVPLPDVTSLDFTMCSLDAGIADIPYPCGVSMGTFNFSLDIPDLPSFNLPLPGLGQLDDVLRDAFSPIADIFDAFRPFFDGLGELVDSLRVIPESVNRIVEEGRGLLSDTRQLFVQWGQTLLIALIVLAVLVVIYFATPMLDSLRRGWRMLRGLSGD
jgi:hypothetical protein